MKINYDAKMIDLLEKNNGKTILLHSCCGPCSSYVIKELCKYLNVTVIYYNPNIEPLDEYILRKNEQIKIIKEYQKEGLNVDFIDCDYENEEFKMVSKGLEKEPEGGARCNKCFYLRLSKTAIKAKENNFDLFGTTLTVSPHKNANVIN